jgi:hypothetical protein
MAAPQAQELMFQNQLQFNLHVPLSTRNLATQFKRPLPVTIERAASSGQGLPVTPVHATKPVVNGNTDISDLEGFHFQALSKERMAMAMQLAQRDLRNKKLQQQMARQRSPSPDLKKQQPVYPKFWADQRSRRPAKKPSQQSVGSWGSKASGAQDRSRASRSAASLSHGHSLSKSPPRVSFINTKSAYHAGTDLLVELVYHLQAPVIS